MTPLADGLDRKQRGMDTMECVDSAWITQARAYAKSISYAMGGSSSSGDGLINQEVTMDRATTPLFLDYTAWRSQNEDMADEILRSLDVEHVADCECVELSKFVGAFEDCTKCDGTGKAGGDAKWEVERRMKQTYETQLEHDYRLAVHCIRR